MSHVKAICPHCKKVAFEEEIQFRRFPVGASKSTFYTNLKKEGEEPVATDVHSEHIEECVHCGKEYLYRLSIEVQVKTAPIEFK